MTEEEERLPPSTAVERLEAVPDPHVRLSLARFRITSAPAGGSAEIRDDLYDDTIELALTQEEMLALSRAAEGDHPETSLDTSTLIATGALLRDQSIQARRWPPLAASSVLAIVIGTLIGVLWAVAADRSSTVVRLSSAATWSAKSLDSPVRFSNPFDASEVFEFPPGTHADQARQAWPLYFSSERATAKS